MLSNRFEDKITALRMNRQYLTKKADFDQYDELFRQMSPVPTVFWTQPGNPPSMYYRTAFDDFEYNFKRRSRREIIKGRFQGGSVGYIEAAELELYAALYKKKSEKLTYGQAQMLDLLEREGPASIGQLKEITGMRAKNITPILHALQEMFLVFEDQTDNEGDRGWFILSGEFPEADLNKYCRADALKKVILRFAKLNVLFDVNMLKSFYKLPLKDIKTAVVDLVKDKKLNILETDGASGYMLPGDLDELKETSSVELPHSIYVLHKNDYIVKCNEHALKGIYKRENYDILQYILINGSIKGAVIGKFRFGPNDINDIYIEPETTEGDEFRNELIEAVCSVNGIDLDKAVSSFEFSSIRSM